jgi:sulfate transport system substrate-binding protein
MRLLLALTALGMLAPVAAPLARAAETTLLNVSYDPTRELYADYDAVFAAFWKQRMGADVTIRTSNGGSGAQARAVIDGLDADVVTLALQPDIDAIAAKSKEIGPNWRDRLPNHSVPYTSTIVFMVRKGNPRGIHDWPDLIKPGVQVITPNPKTSGGARWNFLAAWGAAQKAGTDPRAYVTALYKNVPIMDSGARGSLITFAQRGQGDVLIAWEDDAFRALTAFGADKLEVVNPSVSIEADPVVAVVDAVVDKRGTRAVAEAYLRYLFTPDGQEVVVRHHDRPTSPYILQKYPNLFPKIPMFTVDQQFGGWAKAQAEFFADGGVFDQIEGAR